MSKISRRKRNRRQWIRALRDFDALEINPCVLVAPNGETIRRGEPVPDGAVFEACEENHPDIYIWSVYGHEENVGVDCLSDHKTEKAAIAKAELFKKWTGIEWNHMPKVATATPSTERKNQ